MSSTGVSDLPQSVIPSTDAGEAFQLPETPKDLARPDQHLEVEAALQLLPKEEEVPEPAPEKPEEPEKQEEPVAPEPQDSHAELLARIAKSERRLLDEKAALKADREALEAKKAELEALLEEDKEDLEDFLDDLKRNPITQLTRLGFSHDDIANMLLKGEGQAPKQAPSSLEEKLLSKIESLEQQIKADKEERQREQSQKSIKQQVDDYKNSLNTLLDTEDYELLKTMPNATHEIMSFASGIMQQKQQYLQPKEAADMMLEHYKAHLSQLSSNPVARQLLGLKSEEAKPEAEPEVETTPSPTLTKSMQEAPVREREPEPGLFETEHQEIQAALSKVPKDIWETME